MEPSSDLIRQAADSPDGEQSSLFDLGGVDESKGATDEQNEDTEVSSGSGGTVPCDFCNRPVRTDDPNAYQEIVSWVSGERKGNTALRTYTGKYAHRDCISKVRAGMAPDENSVFDEQPVESGYSPTEIDTEVSVDWRRGYVDGFTGFTSSDLLTTGSLDYVAGFNAGQGDRETKNNLFAQAGAKEKFVTDPVTNRRVIQ